MKLTTHNINGIKARLERLTAYLERERPDVLCLQEVKSVDAAFPRARLEALGYHVETHGQRAYNGVAILSLEPPTDVTRGLPGEDDPQARFVSALVDGIRVASVYVPNGEAVGSDKFAYKLRFLGRLRDWIAARSPSEPLAIGGDYNVAPEDIDCHDPAAWAGGVLFTREEKAALLAARGERLVDAFREKNPGIQAFSWWDYRMLGFPKNRGLRIDHWMVSHDVLSRTKQVYVDRDERKGKDASDHAPVTLELG